MKLKTFKINKRRVFNRGFTLMEFFTIIVIFIILSTVTATNYGDFQAESIVRNLAYDIALSVRQAQTFGISSTNPDEPLSPSSTKLDNKSIQGIYFEGNDKFYIFRDINGDGYFVEADDVIIEERTIATGDTISSVCVGDDAASCADIGSDNLVVTFRRPFSDAIVKKNLNVTLYPYAKITIQSGRKPELQKGIEIWASGAIRVVSIE